MIGTVTRMCIIIVLLAGSPAGASDEPTVLPDRIVFVGGKSLHYVRSKGLHQDPNSTRGMDVVSLVERPVLLKAIRRVVVVREEQHYEGGAIRISVYDFSGTLFGQSQNVAWEADGLFFLESEKRIFVGQSSSHVKVAESFLYDENGRLVRRILQPPDVAAFGHSKDEKLIWIVSNVWLPAGKKVGELRVIDTNGDVVARREFEHAETVVVPHKGQTYRIPVEVPARP
jgi:hypothetical protein